MPDTESRPLHEAEINKLRAEAAAVSRQAEAEFLKASAAARKDDAEAQKLAAEADEAAAKAKKANIDLAREQRKRDKELVADEYHHRYVFMGSVDNNSAQKCIDQLDFWDRTEEPSEIQISFFSPGGGVFAGMALFDHILSMRKKGWHITTSSRGYAASMGGILVQAGDVRTMGPESFLHIHEVAAGAMGKTSDLEDEVALMKKMEARVVDIFAARSNMSKTTIRNRMRRKEWWIDSTEALKLGLIDEIA